MKRACIITLLLILSSTLAFSQKSFMTYYQMKDYLYASPSAFKYGLDGFSNPSLLNTMQESDIQFTFTNANYVNQNTNWGIFSGGPNAGGGVIRTTNGKGTIYDYRYAFSFGNNEFGLGAGYGFVGGNKGYFKRSNIFYFGSFYRPLPYVSIGLQFTQAIDNHDQEYVAELGIRPIKNYPLTFFGDYAMFENQSPQQASWSGGISYEFLDGLRFSGRYFNDKTFSVGIDISFGKFGVGTQAQFGDNKQYGYSAYTIRMGALDRTILKSLFPEKKLLKIDLNGGIKYQKFAMFDNSNTLLGILDLIDEAKKSDKIVGIVINTSGMSANQEILWEIREKLREFKKAGKVVYIFTDRMDIDIYHFASVADKIIMDEQGAMTLEGYMLNRSYYKAMFEKVGLGFEELRYFKYKSAVEGYSRDKMSDADREQRQKIVDDWFKISKDEICQSRGFSPEKFDSLVNGKMMYSTKEAIEGKMVDVAGRWIDYDDIIKKIRTDEISFIEPAMFRSDLEPIDDKWGQERKEIAVVYAIGECAMDQGIKARTLINDLKSAMNNNKIKAIVLRVDSPGGDPMASDYIADVIKSSKNKKPVIVSQGMVAGSGGYWLSMYGNKIVAAPMTITGSIGVIGGRIYSKGLKESLGISVDMVKAGKYADMEQSFSLPLIGIGLPVRNFNDEEKVQLEKDIRTMYGDFVNKVAFGRKMSSDSVERIAQGRIWSGLDGKQNGLVDEIGGLSKALEMAKEAAGIPQKEQIAVVEYPAPGFIDFLSLLTSATGVNLKSKLGVKENSSPKNDVMDYIKFRVKNNDRPLTVMPIEFQDLVPVE